MWAALGCLGFSLLLSLNRALNRRALSGGRKCEYDWPREIVVVTGGSGGIGGELVQKLAAQGITVAVLDVIPLTFDGGSYVHYFRCDVASLEALHGARKAIIAKLGREPTVLVANAGVARGRTILDAEERDIRLTFDVNVLGLLWSVKTFLPDMVKADHGHVLVTSSVTGFLTAANIAYYSSSKTAVTSLVEGLQTELIHKHGNPRVAVSVIFPGLIKTDMFRGVKEGSTGFMMPELTPGRVAERMFQMLRRGQSELVMMPAISNLMPWVRALPHWMRVASQSGAADAMDHIHEASR